MSRCVTVKVASNSSSSFNRPAPWQLWERSAHPSCSGAGRSEKGMRERRAFRGWERVLLCGHTPSCWQQVSSRGCNKGRQSAFQTPLKAAASLPDHLQGSQCGRLGRIQQQQRHGQQQQELCFRQKLSQKAYQRKS